jgi:hypothetical protein
MRLELIRPVRTLMMKFNLFADDPMLLNASYAVRATVSGVELLLPLEEKDVEATNANIQSFSIVRRVRFLVSESGFRHLSREWQWKRLKRGSLNFIWGVAVEVRCLQPLLLCSLSGRRL